jgi:hypothetical protein
MALGSILSGITKVFTSLGTGAAQLGSAVRAVGTSLFTGMAATGTGLSAAAQGGGGLSSLLGGGGGVLGNILSGAIQQGLTSGLAGGAIGAMTGEGFGSGFKTGAMTGALSGGVQGAFSPTGFGSAGTATGFNADPMAGGTGTLIGNDGTAGRTLAGGGSTDVMTSAHAIERGRDAMAVGRTIPGPTPTPATGTNVFPAVPQQPGGFGKGLGDFLQSNAGAGLIGGIGESIAAERLIEAQMENAEANRKFLTERDQKITDSYKVGDEALPGENAEAKASSTRSKGTPKWTYNPGTGMIDYA